MKHQAIAIKLSLGNNPVLLDLGDYLTQPVLAEDQSLEGDSASGCSFLPPSGKTKRRQTWHPALRVGSGSGLGARAGGPGMLGCAALADGATLDSFSLATGVHREGEHSGNWAGSHWVPEGSCWKGWQSVLRISWERPYSLWGAFTTRWINVHWESWGGADSWDKGILKVLSWSPSQASCPMISMISSLFLDGTGSKPTEKVLSLVFFKASNFVLQRCYQAQPLPHFHLPVTALLYWAFALSSSVPGKGTPGRGMLWILGALSVSLEPHPCALHKAGSGEARKVGKRDM